MIPDRCPAHLQFVRGFSCAVKDCNGDDIHAHHVRSGSMAGTGRKPPDSDAIPLCGTHHLELHTSGELKFYLAHRINYLDLIVWFASHSPPLRRRRAA